MYGQRMNVDTEKWGSHLVSFDQKILENKTQNLAIDPALRSFSFNSKERQ